MTIYARRRSLGRKIVRQGNPHCFRHYGHMAIGLMIETDHDLCARLPECGNLFIREGEMQKLDR